jgi:hypothetical protein
MSDLTRATVDSGPGRLVGLGIREHGIVLESGWHQW